MCIRALYLLKPVVEMVIRPGGPPPLDDESVWTYTVSGDEPSIEMSPTGWCGLWVVCLGRRWGRSVVPGVGGANIHLASHHNDCFRSVPLVSPFLRLALSIFQHCSESS